MRWFLAVTAAIVGVAVAAGCASRSHEPGSRRSEAVASALPLWPSSGPHFIGPVRQRIDYDHGSIVLDPPGRKAAALTWQRAVHGCRGRCITGAAPEVSLAIATTLRSGTSRPDGSLRPGTDHELTYVLVARHQPCGAPAGPLPADRGPTGDECTFIQLIDADTGTIGYAMSGRFAVAYG